MRLLIPEIVKQSGYEWYTTNAQYTIGKKQHLKEYNCYQIACGRLTEWGHPSGEFSNIVDELDPDVIMVYDDVQKIGPWAQHIWTRPWMAWFPKDNEEKIKQEFNTVARVPHPVTFSRFASNWFKNNGLVVPYVYQCVDCKTYRPIKNTEEYNKFYKLDTVHVNEKIEEDEIMLLFVGRQNWRKNIQLLMCATRMLLDRGLKIKLYMHTDPADPGGAVAFQKLSHGLRLQKNILITARNVWHKGIPDFLMNMIYNRADIYVTTHGGEGFGSPMAEAMACGLPVIATDYTTTREFVGDNEERGIAVPWETKMEDKGVHRPMVNMEEFVNAIQYLIDNPKERRRMGMNAAQYARKTFDVPIIAKQLVQQLEQFNVNRCTVS